ncbi:hypothetical protein ACFFKG_01005 [Aureimonas pseudogalii]|uniref:hypothetical protein n=1 Tax=Aureimonas pseudogalii TaxID=1744844 RepID=UPI00160565F1|nr:hypothetical protein [Aureimonas pseudogalii]
MVVDLAKLGQRKARLEASLAAATTTLRDAERRADSRRKIVAGAALLSAVREGAVPAEVLVTLVARMSARDAELFVGSTSAAQHDVEPSQ